MLLTNINARITMKSKDDVIQVFMGNSMLWFAEKRIFERINGLLKKNPMLTFTTSIPDVLTKADETDFVLSSSPLLTLELSSEHR